MTVTPGFSTLTTTADLEAVVGARTDAGTYKSITFLDQHCDAMLVRSPLSFLGTVDGDGRLRTTVMGGAPGHTSIGAPTRLDLLALGSDDALVDGAPAGLLTLVPGYGETLRVNGRLRLGAGESLASVEVEEAFVHCAKAILRSKLWSAEPVADDPWADVGEVDDLDHPAVRAFLAASPFLALTSVDGHGRADVSPKGDPAGFVHVLEDGRIAIPDRPGNLRTDTLHNLMDRPELSVLAVVPGAEHVLELSGRATVTDDASLLAALSANGKAPAAAVVVEVAHVGLRPEPALDAAALWDTSRHLAPGELPRASQMWSDHVQIHAGLGVGDDADRLVPVDELHLGIEQNYRDGLY